MEVLRDQIWTFVGAAVAVVAIIVMIAIYIWQKQRKRLAIETLGSFPLVDREKRKINGLAFTFNGDPVDDATVVFVRVSNVGNTPILSGDFEKPIALEFKDGASVLSVDVIETSPPGIPTNVATERNIARISGTLLNPDDSFILRFLLLGEDGTYTRTGRIAGVKALESSGKSSMAPLLFGLVGISLFIAAGIRSPHLFGITEPKPGDFLSLVGALLGMLAMLAGLGTDLKRTIERRLRFGPLRIRR